jgi:hypothetical protein
MGRRTHEKVKVTVKVMVKIKVKVNFTIEHATKTYRGVDVKLYSFFNLGARWRGWSTPHPGRFTPGKDPVSFV